MTIFIFNNFFDGKCLTSHILTVDTYIMNIDTSICSVAVIGGGAAGAATLHSLVAENFFNKIRLFERKDKAGGLWYVTFSNLIRLILN